MTEPPCAFVFDAIVPRYKLPRLKINDRKLLTVEVTFGLRRIVIKSDRQHVNDFPPNTSYGFLEGPKRLRESLEKSGMPIKVRYNNELIGSGEIRILQTTIDGIKEGMQDLVLADSCPITKGGQIMGTVELLCRVIIKCEDKLEQADREGNKCGQNVDKSINPRDIMFIMGERQLCPNPTDICPDVLAPDEDDDCLEVDMHRYRSLRFPNDPVQYNKSVSFLTQQIAQRCGEVLDSVIKSPAPSAPRQPRESFAQVPFKAHMIHAPISDLSKPDIKPTRFCPVCLNNMSWLPKFATCPKCGIKPTPVVEDRHKDKKHTAEKILSDYLGTRIEEPANPCRKTMEPKKEQQEDCRCTCQYGKICAHCRIRKLCVDIFQSEEKLHDGKPQPSDYFFTVENQEEKRPYLSRVFSELRDLYNVKEVKLQSRYDKMSSKSSMHSRLTCRKQSIVDIKARTTKSSLHQVRSMSKPDSRPAYLKKKTQSSQLRHKECVNQRFAVPKHHGWNWQDSPESRKHGWRPGYILKPIQRLMKFFLQYLPEENVCKRKEQERVKRQQQQPVLNVCKKEGGIFITLRAVYNPDMEMAPITFKIVKSDQAVALSQIKRELKDRGFRKCTCHKSLMMCVCRNQMEKRQLGCALQKACHHRGIENCVSQLVLTDTSDSEMEYNIDVSPPVDAVKPPKQLKARQVNRITQTSHLHTKKVQPNYPMTNISPYWRTYDCAAGDRYRSTAFGKAGEVVFEDGVFGYRGGGAHGQSAALGGRQKSKKIWGNASGEPMWAGGRDGRTATNGMSKKGGPPFGKNFPGAVRKPAQHSPAIPVKMPKRWLKLKEDAERVRQEANKKEMALRKNVNMIKYLNAHVVGSKKGKPVIGPDGLTDAQRRHRTLREMPPHSIEAVPRRGGGYDPYYYYPQWCTPFDCTC